MFTKEDLTEIRDMLLANKVREEDTIVIVRLLREVLGPDLKEGESVTLNVLCGCVILE